MKKINTETNPTPKRLVLSLLGTPDFEQLTLSTLATMVTVFGIEVSAIRVALGRLVRQEMIEVVSRGMYQIGPAASAMSQTAKGWVHAEGSVNSWSGEWIMVHTAHLGRSNKTRLRKRETAFRLKGFKELAGGLWCRPANLTESLADTESGLKQIGLEIDALVYRATEVATLNIAVFKKMWPVAELQQRYQWLTETMLHSMDTVTGLSPQQACRETFNIGEAVIRQINGDPFLPEELIDTQLRRTMIATMKDYNKMGRELWLAYLSGRDSA